MSFPAVSEESGDRHSGFSGEVWNHHQCSGGIGETSRRKRWGSCLLLIIEPYCVFSKTKTARAHAVHWTSILEEDGMKSALSFRDNAGLWWKEIKVMFFCGHRNQSFCCLAVSYHLSSGALFSSSALVTYSQGRLQELSPKQFSARPLSIPTPFRPVVLKLVCTVELPGSFRNYRCLWPTLEIVI